MEYLKLLGVAVGVALLCMCIRKLSPDAVIYVSTAFFILTLGYCISSVKPFIDYIDYLSSGSGFSDCAKIIVKTCAAVLATSFACELCKTCAEPEIAKSAELIGKCTLVLITLPLLKALFNSAAGLAS